ncbi:MAG: hypothetical protein MJ191_07260 [Clostridium sp.]|nr:hypothetical protein [Clostridium sp.]
MRRSEFSKILIIADYTILFGLIVCALCGADLTEVLIAWIGQIGISSGFYFWKARQENKIKIPFRIISSLKPSMRQEIDMTEIIKSILED